jgi:cytidylate kinase
MLAQRLGWTYLDSGALYRLLALAALQRTLPLTDAAGLALLATQLDVRFVMGANEAEDVVLLASCPVQTQLRSETCAQAASCIAALPPVRAALLGWQRRLRQPPGLVADGRDMGTVVFPDATIKIFLTASLATRAERRYKQLKEKGLSANLANLEQILAERDARDTARACAPLLPAADAEYIDSSALTLDQVFERILAVVGAAGIIFPTALTTELT